MNFPNCMTASVEILQISATIGEQITKLQQQNQEFSQLLDSLNSGNSAIADSIKNAQTTRTSLEQIAENNKNSLRDYKKLSESGHPSERR